MLKHLYRRKQAARRAALHAWKRIDEVPDIVRENSEEPGGLRKQ